MIPAMTLAAGVRAARGFFCSAEMAMAVHVRAPPKTTRQVASKVTAFFPPDWYCWKGMTCPVATVYFTKCALMSIYMTHTIRLSTSARPT